MNKLQALKCIEVTSQTQANNGNICYHDPVANCDYILYENGYVRRSLPRTRLYNGHLDTTHAIYQLNRSSGNTVTFLTSLCLLNSKTGQHQVTIVPYSVEFLPLTQGQISAYLLKEQPYQCAGSFKSEGLGITLFKRFEGDDPNSLIGLPLIALTEMLRKEGVEPLIET